MRPLKVEMVGFSAFRDPTTVDFTDVDLAALVGATGSGKSTIVDAITFALFGSVARYDDKRLVAPVINQLCNEAKVRLDFEVGGETYSAVRVLRRTERGATTKGAQLERGMEVVASSSGELGPAVEELLGMDFDQFTKTVVLPQGDFATFLHDRPADRQELLRRLLDLGIYARMGKEARSRASTAQTRLETLVEQLGKGEDFTDEYLAALGSRVKVLAKLRKRLATEIEKLAALELVADELSEAQARMAAQLDTLGELVVPDSVASLGKELSEASDALAAAIKATKEARAARMKAEKAVETGPDRATCQQLLEAYSEREQLEGAIAELEAAAADKAEALEQATAKATNTREGLEESDRLRQAARLAAGAAGLKAALVVGEPCPVCEQVVTEVPDHDLDEELAAAEVRREKARATAERRESERVKAQEKHAQAKADLVAARKRLSALGKKLKGTPTEKKLEADIQKAELLAKARTEAATATHEAEGAEEEARSTYDGFQESERALRIDYGKARDSATELDPPAAAGASLHDDWTALSTWASSTTKSVEKAHGANKEQLDTKSEQRDKQQRAVLDLCKPHLDGEVPDKLTEHFAQLAIRAEADLEHAHVRHKELEEMRASIADLEIEARVAGELGRLLQATGFERWLMQEAMIDLVDRATDRLLELSGGQYSLIADETDFRVQDHRNADEVRDARTLSGGETFLVSLALALALADSVAELAPEGSPRLESIFLDEGFGSLDPETLDVVASAIEELGASGRMVGIVTHIRELADRMPVRFEVTKGATSSSVERVEV